jgi:hypothetical protein
LAAIENAAAGTRDPGGAAVMKSHPQRTWPNRTEKNQIWPPILDPLSDGIEVAAIAASRKNRQLMLLHRNRPMRRLRAKLSSPRLA